MEKIVLHLRRYSSDNTLSSEMAGAVYDILVAECGAPVEQREVFIQSMGKANSASGREIRFEGQLGFGGKLHLQRSRLWVSCYFEDETPDRLARIERAHRALETLFAAQLA